MISDSKPSNLPHENLYRNVSMNMLSLIPSDIRHLYEEVSPMMGVYTKGAFPNDRQAVAVSGLTSCAGLILSSDENYLAIHLGGDAKSLYLYQDMVEEFCGKNARYQIAAAAGSSGSGDSVLKAFDKLICEYTGRRTDEFSIYKNLFSIAIGSHGTVGIPNLAAIKPAARKKGSSGCTIL